MGVYIKGMKMPKSCWDCNFAVDGVCVAMRPVSARNWKAEETTNYCPLVHVPPHGRLIDADALRKCGLLYREGMYVGGLVYIPIRDVFRSINTAPTVIEAEEGE